MVRARASAVAALVVAAVFVSGQPDSDPWAPGTSLEPWPLIESLQSTASLGSDGEGWQRAFSHPDPRVRAAAAWAAGRTRPAGAATALGTAAFDADQIVRDAAVWALLNVDDRAALPHLARVLGSRRELTRAGMSTSTRHVGEPSAGFWTLFSLRGIPFLEGTVAFRREWLQHVDLAALELRDRNPHTRSGILAFNWTTARAEWNADERVPIRAAVARGEGDRSSAEPLRLETHLVPLDEPDTGPHSHERRVRIPVRLRRADDTERDVLQLAPEARAEIDLVLSLHEMPPGCYLLEGLETGHPLLLRVRRSPRREVEVQRAAAAARTPAEIDAVSRQRVASQADRWRGELKPLLVPGATTPLPVAHLRALAQLGDAGAAGLLVDALSATPRLRDEYREIEAEHVLVRAFGAAALPHLERAARAWRQAVDERGASPFPLSVLRARSLASSALDDVRVEVLRELASRATPRPLQVMAGVPEANAREAFLGALVAVAARRPRDAGRALAAVADRPSMLVQALAAFDPPDYTGYPYAADLDGVDAMLQAAWSAVPAAMPPDSRSALVAEGERLGIDLTGADSVMPASSEEAVREITRVAPNRASYWPMPGTGPSRTLRRILASGLAEAHGPVALAAARLALTLTDYEAAARLAERALQLTPSFPARAAALLTRSEVHAELGDAARQRADLEEALPHLGPNSGEAEVRTKLHALEGLPRSLQLRTRARPRPGMVVLGPDGALVEVTYQLVERRDILRGGSRWIGVAPWRTQALAPLGGHEVAVLGEDGSIGLVREGQRGLVWRATVAGAKDAASRRPMALLARGDTVLVRDATQVVHAFDARTGKRRWSRPGHESVPLMVDGDDPIVLGASPPTSPHEVRNIVGVDPPTGRVRWSVILEGPVQAWHIGNHRVAWLGGKGTLRELDVRSGVARTELALVQPNDAQAGVAVAVVPDAPRIVVALSDRFLMVENGKLAWSHDRPGASQSSVLQKVEVGSDGVIWRIVTGNGPVVAEAWTMAGERVAAHEVAKWGGVATSMLQGSTLAIWNSEVMVLLDCVMP